MKNIFRKFGVRVTMAIVVAMVVVVVFCNALVYRFAMDSQFENLRDRLESIAQTSTLIIDASKLEQIPLTPQGISTPEFEYVNNQLRKIKAANPKIKYIYVLKKVDQSDQWRFVIDFDPKEEGNNPALPGTPYDAGRFTEMLNGFNAPSSDKKIEIDEWGKTLSGYAPIRDEQGRPVAVLGVDILADDVVAMRHEVTKRALVVLLLGLILALAIGIAISRRVVGPMEQFITGARYIAKGHLHHQVHVWGDDEISALAGEFNKMSKELQQSRGKLMGYFYDTVNSMVRILEIRDQYTLGHSESVANYSAKIAAQMGFDEKLIETFKRVALLHDIGKVGVRDSVLLKPDKLNDQEWEAIKIHPVLGEQILKPILEDALMLAVIRNHHERFDGKGYPDGLAYDKIPLLVSIVTVADSYDAMTSNRAYRKALSQEEALDQLKKGSGTQFHPDVVDAFVALLREENKA